MAKATVYKQAKSWVFENLSLTPNASPKKLFDMLEATFPPEEVPTNAHAVATWVREFKAKKKDNELDKVYSLFDPINTFNDPEYRDLFSSDDKGWLIQYQNNLHQIYTQPMGLPSSLTQGVAIWVNKLKNAMPMLADRPLDLYIFALGLLTLETRPDSEANVEKAKTFIYAQPYISVDNFKQWIAFNTEDLRSMPVDVFNYINLDNTKPDPKADKLDYFRWWMQLPELVSMNFALMPQYMPHIKMLNFVHWSLHKFLSGHIVGSVANKDLEIKVNPLWKYGDKDLMEEVDKTMKMVQGYFNQINVENHVQINTLRLFQKIEDKYNTQMFVPEELPSQIFDYYWAILINTFSLAKSGGKLLGGLTIYPYSKMLKFKDLLPISHEARKKKRIRDQRKFFEPRPIGPNGLDEHFKAISESVQSKGNPLPKDTKGKP